MKRTTSLFMLALVFGVGCNEPRNDDGIPLVLLTSLTSTDLHVFLASGATGARSGVTGFDTLCAQSTSGHGPGSYKAFVADSTRRPCTTANCSGGASENLNWILKPNRTYYRDSNFVRTTIGVTNSAGIFAFPLSNSMHTGFTAPWTGLNTNWTVSTDTCSNWSTTAGNGARGDGSSTSNTAINNSSSDACSNANTFLCVEQ